MSTAQHTSVPPHQQAPDRRRAHWTTRLLDERAFRADQIRRLDQEIANTPALATDTITTVLRTNACAALRGIDDALARLVTGRFGRCVSCGHAIDPVRLDVLPMTARCMACQYRDDPDRDTDLRRSGQEGVRAGRDARKVHR